MSEREVTHLEATTRMCRWRSWDGDPDRLTVTEELELLEVLSDGRSLPMVPFTERLAAAELLAEQYEHRVLKRS